MRAAALGLLALAACAQAGPPPGAPAGSGLTFVALGDQPYNMLDVGAYGRLIDRINTLAPAFAIHVGDIKDGSSACTDRVFKERLAEFQRFRVPLIYTPGDNEWTDCHRSGGDPAERLVRLRALFFPAPASLGAPALPLATQAARGFPENARWSRDGVTLATLHVVGSRNNRGRDRAEFEARSAANLAWLEEAFAAAKAAGHRAVVLAMQADPGFQPRPRPEHGFAELLAALVAAARGFDGTVLLIHGDSHAYVFDRPLKDAAGRPVENLIRLEVPGGHGDVRAVAVTLSPGAPDPVAVRQVDPEPPR
ncbi:MAG TPA: hypothetical protein VEH84_16520 [Alphaproteobacteria bacterium]|nr:hypothetical protein [Alphaproteobacteria bacterium]